MSNLSIGYVNVFVSDYEAAVKFFTEALGLKLNSGDEAFGYASFDAGTISFAIAKTDDAFQEHKKIGIRKSSFE